MSGILYIVGGFIELLIGLRFVFRLLGANPDSAIVGWIYNWSMPLVKPFAGVFGQNAAATGHGIVSSSVFDWTALIALIIYGALFALLSKLAAHRR